jgi:hypothetical protein
VANSCRDISLQLGTAPARGRFKGAKITRWDASTDDGVEGSHLCTGQGELAASVAHRYLRRRRTPTSASGGMAS